MWGSCLPARREPQRSKSGVSFGYPGAETDVLHRVSLVVPAGTQCAIVGESGCGKSTLLALILGLQAPREGPFESPAVPRAVPGRTVGTARLTSAPSRICSAAPSGRT